MQNRSSKRPRDGNQLAKLIVDTAKGNAPKEEPPPAKNAAAVELGRLGGLKGGKARAAKLSPAKRKAISKKAAAERWRKAYATGASTGLSSSGPAVSSYSPGCRFSMTSCVRSVSTRIGSPGL